MEALYVVAAAVAAALPGPLVQEKMEVHQALLLEGLAEEPQAILRQLRPRLRVVMGQMVRAAALVRLLQVAELGAETAVELGMQELPIMLGTLPMEPVVVVPPSKLEPLTVVVVVGLLQAAKASLLLPTRPQRQSR